jgi:hypothetical protein
MGAFSAVRVHFDGQRVPDDAAWLHPAGASVETSLATVDREHPVALEIGRRTTVRLRLAELPGAGHHLVRVEAQSVAIPPLVWFQFTDDLHDATAPP